MLSSDNIPRTNDILSLDQDNVLLITPYSIPRIPLLKFNLVTKEFTDIKTEIYPNLQFLIENYDQVKILKCLLKLKLKKQLPRDLILETYSFLF